MVFCCRQLGRKNASREHSRSKKEKSPLTQNNIDNTDDNSVSILGVENFSPFSPIFSMANLNNPNSPLGGNMFLSQKYKTNTI